ncbi:MAG: pyridoxal-phosphate dependent enzyme, partial [Candidatus Diapherotrites archaeon]|nr:pyridoxal-phosphate dependent enzyme [Candidatus Diapherotrites archaeon]
QKRQLDTIGDNVRSVSVDGKFDDCQAIAKQSFVDQKLRSLNLSSANSISVGRLLPQAAYYFYGYSKALEQPGEKIVFAVPSGNFGNFTGGIIANRMGLPVEKFVVAVNGNDEFPRFLETGKYEKVAPSRECLSNAMNVGHPSNLARVVELYGGRMDESGGIIRPPDLQKMRRDIFSLSVSDSQTKQAIKEAYLQFDTVLEPHGAVAWFGLQRFLERNPANACVSIETAHPAKFPKVIRETIGIDPKLPKSLAGLEKKKEEFEKMPNDYGKFREFLVKNF